MSTVAPSSEIGGGLATESAVQTPISLTSEAFKQELVSIYKVSPESATEDFDKFVSNFCSPENNLIGPHPPIDLDHRLTSYFISSSHNTYLVDHQLYGKSTVQGYVNVLKRACRCIEIDLWDGDDGEPKVDHGWTLTESVKFKDVCDAIAKYAFVASDLPLIVSLECHADQPQQEKAVDIMRAAWKDLLLEGELPDWNVPEKGLPPPGRLKHKILVKAIFKKVKYLPPDAQPGGQPVAGVQSLTSQTRKLTVNDDDDDSETEQSSRGGSDTEGGKKPPKVKICAALSSLGVYTSAMKFAESFSDAVSTRPNHVFSFSEKKFDSLHEAQADALFQHNRQFLTRVYPHGLRVSSSNLHPQDYWMRGAQLVALNWQKTDKGMMLNEAMFAGTGGYVLKPQSHLLDVATQVALKDLERTVDLKITVLAGQDLPLPKGDDKPKDFQPYVKATLSVSRTVKYKDKIKHGKGQNYRWEKSNVMAFKASGVVPEVSFVRFKLFDDEFGRDDKAGWACVRLDRLRTGYGYLKLFDMKGRETDGVLLLKIEKTVT